MDIFCPYYSLKIIKRNKYSWVSPLQDNNKRKTTGFANFRSFWKTRLILIPLTPAEHVVFIVK